MPDDRAMADLEQIAVTRDGPVATVRIERRKALNALDPATLRELARAPRRATRPGIRALVVTGSGDEAFSAGADIGAWPR
jgi:enoyl-CoA hydratase/carnithine racemase